MEFDWNIDAFWLLGIILIPPVTTLVWLFGLRPFVARNGRARVTAANWGLSMWADWTTSLEITRETGRRCWSGWAFLTLQVIWICLIVSMFVVLGGRK